MHLGWEKTLDKVTTGLLKSASGKTQVELHSIPKISVPWHTIHVDISGKLSGKSDRKEYIIVQIDAFTRYVYLYHTFSLDSNTCINTLKLLISMFGVPTRLIADQRRSFIGIWMHRENLIKIGK